jgi:hypothetical protein
LLLAAWIGAGLVVVAGLVSYVAGWVRGRRRPTWGRRSTIGGGAVDGRWYGIASGSQPPFDHESDERTFVDLAKDRTA